MKKGAGMIPTDESVPVADTAEVLDANATSDVLQEEVEYDGNNEQEVDHGQRNDDGVAAARIETDRIAPAATTATTATTASKEKAPKSAASTRAHTKEIGNGLTALIPGYVAPLALDTSALNPYKATLQELTRKAQQTDLSNKRFALPTTLSASSVTRTSAPNFLPSTYAAYSFKLGKKKAPDLSAGKGWFSMMSCEITDQIKTDMQVIRNRTYLNPKTFYKKADKFGTHVQVGTVIEGSAEFYSSRLTNKERRSDLTQEIMANSDTSSYVKRKFTTIQHERQAVTEHFQKHKRKSMKKGRRGL